MAAADTLNPTRLVMAALIGLDEKTTLKTWTIMETLVGTAGFLVALVISFFA